MGGRRRLLKLSRGFERLALLYGVSLSIHVAAAIVWNGDIMGDPLENVARNLLAGRGYTYSTEEIRRTLVEYPPGYPLFLAGLYALGVDARIGIRLIQAFLTSAMPVFLLATVERLTGRQVRTATAAVALAYPLWLAADVAFGAQGLMLLMVAASMWFLVHKGPKRVVCLPLAAAATLFRSEAALFMAAVYVVSFVWARGARKAWFIAAAVGVGMYIPWIMVLSSAAGHVVLNPPVAGVAAMSVVGKWDRSSGLPYGDGEVVRSEGGQEIYYPAPFERDKARLRKTWDYIRRHPTRYARIVLTNAAAMTFGQKLYISEVETMPSLQRALLREGRGLGEVWSLNWFALVQRAIASLCAFGAVLGGAATVWRLRSKETLTLFIVGVGYMILTGLFGVLARHSWVGLQLWFILMLVGIDSLLTFRERTRLAAAS